MADDNTKYGQYIRRAKNHPVIAVLLVAGTAIVLIVTFLVTVMSGIDIFRSGDPEDAVDHAADSVRVVDSAPKETIKAPEQVFGLIGFGDDALVAAIERETGYKHSKSSLSNRVEVVYSGSLVKVTGSELYYYDGGNLRIIVDGQECATLSSIEIDPSLRAGNHYGALHTWLSEKVDSLASENPEQIAERVTECLQ